MRMREALASLIRALGWEAESDTTSGMVSQLSRMVDVSDGRISVKEPPAYVAKVGKVGFTSMTDAISAANGRVIRLVADLTEPIVLNGWTQAAIDMNGHSLVTSGCAVDNSGRVELRNGTVESTDSYAIASRSGSTTALYGMVIKSVEGAVITGKATDAVISIGNCELHASDNAVIAGNGSEGFGGNSFTVVGSTIHGQTKSPGYVACGIYCPTKDTFAVTGCEVSVDGGCGVLSRAGKVSLRATKITTTGDATGKVSDSMVVVPCSAVVFDEEAAYPSLTGNDKITVSDCELSSDVDTLAVIGTGDRIEVL